MSSLTIISGQKSFYREDVDGKMREKEIKTNTQSLNACPFSAMPMKSCESFSPRDTEPRCKISAFRDKGTTFEGVSSHSEE